MAIMIPSEPKEYDPWSKEGVIFQRLKKGLPNDYYVFHSYHVTNVTPLDEMYDREMDFVIANKTKGILCLEAKAGRFIDFEDRTWKYSSGIPMEHGGPYNQVATAKRTLIEAIKFHPDREVRRLLKKIKFLHGVIFPTMTRERFDGFQGLPEDADGKITMCAEDLMNPKEKIEEMFRIMPAFEDFRVEKTELSDDEFRLLLEAVLCPKFHIIPSPKSRNILLGLESNQLLQEQYRILDFLEEQRMAVINGAAGTGKTMLAKEKARLHSKSGDKVLFLCYNALLRKSLIAETKEAISSETRKEFENVDFMTISQLAREKTGDFADYDRLNDWLKRCKKREIEFGYRHIIIDEGQDFGLIDSEISVDDQILNTSIINTLQEIAAELDGTFYLFYDKHQMIQGAEDGEEYLFPDCIENADCRLTLHKNCRNTQEIARTSVTPLKDKKKKAVKPVGTCFWGEAPTPTMHLVQNRAGMVQSINAILDRLENESIEDVVILTTGITEYSCVSNSLVSGNDMNDSYSYYPYKGKNYRITTCKKYKGLEADAVILIDLDKSSFEGKKGMQFYVGTSRAKISLDFVCKLIEQDYYEVIHSIDPSAPKRPSAARMKNMLASTFSTNVVQE